MVQRSRRAQGSRAKGRSAPPGPEGDLATAALLVAAVWGLLLAGALLEGPLGRPPALLLAFAAAAALALRLRPDGHLGGAKSAALVGIGIVLGYASFPAWIVAIGATGSTLGLALREPLPPGHGGPVLWLASVALAPLFEEIAYRGRLLPALVPTLGLLPSFLVTSTLFALPHLEPWPMLGTFLAGLYLASLMHVHGSLALCIGVHAGLNAASVLCGLPPVRRALPPELALLAALVPLAPALADPLSFLTRIRSRRSRVRPR